LKQAVIASEDKDFLRARRRQLHRADARHLPDVRAARPHGGRSTLSQQTAKAIMASVEGEDSVRIRSGWAGVRRKAREFILTRRLENNFDKEHILWCT